MPYTCQKTSQSTRSTELNSNTHVEKVFHGTVGVVETGSECSHNLIPLETHLHEVVNRVLVLAAPYERAVVVDGTLGLGCRRCLGWCENGRIGWLGRSGGCS